MPGAEQRPTVAHSAPRRGPATLGPTRLPLSAGAPSASSRHLTHATAQTGSAGVDFTLRKRAQSIEAAIMPLCWRRLQIEPPRRRCREPVLPTKTLARARLWTRCTWLNRMSADATRAAQFGAGGNIAYGPIDRVYQLQGVCCGRHSMPLQPLETSLTQLGTGYPIAHVQIKLRCRESDCPQCGIQMAPRGTGREG